MFCHLLVLFNLVLWCVADNDLDKLFKDTKVIPDVLTTAPKEKLKVNILLKETVTVVLDFGFFLYFCSLNLKTA